MSYSEEFILKACNQLSLWLGKFHEYKRLPEKKEAATADLPAFDTWQFRAIESAYNSMFRGISEDKTKGKSDAYLLGFAQGAISSSFDLSEDDIEAAPDSLMDGMYIPAEIKELMESPDREELVEKHKQNLDNASLGFKAEYYNGLADGMRSISANKELRYSSNASGAYISMLLFSDQISLLETWKDFHAFINDQSEAYRNRFDACKKMGQAIGYSPRNESSKSVPNKREEPES